MLNLVVAMQKHEIRREFFNLKSKGHSYAQCKSILRAKCDYTTTLRTLKRWIARLDKGDWDLQDDSTRPKKIHYKVTTEIEREVLEIRQKTGWGCDL